MRTNGFRGTILISWPKACVLSWLQPIFPAPCSGLRTSQGLLPPLRAVAPALASTFLLSPPARSYKTLLNVSVLVKPSLSLAVRVSHSVLSSHMALSGFEHRGAGPRSWHIGHRHQISSCGDLLAPLVRVCWKYW